VVLKRIRIDAARAGTIENVRDWKAEDVSIRGCDGSTAALPRN